MKYPVQTYILMKTWNLLFNDFTGVSQQTMKSILNVKKKPSNLIKVIFSYNNFSGIKSQQAKNRFFIQYKKLNFSQNSSTPCHQVTFDLSISCVPLIDKPNEICKNSKTYERNALSTTNFFKRQLQEEI